MFPKNQSTFMNMRSIPELTKLIAGPLDIGESME